MKREPQDLSGFIKAHRDQPPVAPVEEWQQVLLASRSGGESRSRPGILLPVAIASGVLAGAAVLILSLYPIGSSEEVVADPAGEFLFLSQEIVMEEENSPLDDYWHLAESL